MENQNNYQSMHELDRKNLFFFYRTYYKDFFELLNNLIDEKNFSIKSNKDEVIGFCNKYSYQIIGKPLIDNTNNSKGEESLKDIKDKIESFFSFYESLNKYPTDEYRNILIKLKSNDFEFKKINEHDFYILINEYYDFFNDVVNILKKVVKVNEENGSFPNLKSKKQLRTINFALYDSFYEHLQELIDKVSKSTYTISSTKLLKIKRSLYLVLLVLDPYFKQPKIRDEYLEKLNFNFIKEEDKCKLLFNSYVSKNKIGTEDKKELRNLLEPLMNNVALIQRYISYELGEVGISAKIKNKYKKDPTFF